MPSYADMFEYQLTSSPGEVTYGLRLPRQGRGAFSRVDVTEASAIQRLVWDAATREWKTFYSAPRDVCDAYARCGAFGVCDVGAASTSFCGCARGFSPASPAAWRMREASGRCRRDVPLDDCAGNVTTSTTTDGFVAVRSVKLPDTQNASVDVSITVEECKARCLADCSCVAYAAADIGGGGAGSGCIIWTNDIVDIRYVDKGQDLYLRLAKAELEKRRICEISSDHYTRRISTGIIAAICVVGVIAAIFLVVSFIIWRNKSCKIRRGRDTRAVQDSGATYMEVGKPLNSTGVISVDLHTVEKATRSFSKRNVIGEGAFGVIYEGQLPNDHPLGDGLPGRKVAVKRLKLSSLPNNRILNDFTREVEVMSKLRHDNLVRLLAYCDEGNERLLVYEYMQNRSLNLYIFGKPNIRASLNWPKRLEVIHGIARGVCYLHEGRGEIVVIHRDLKPSNVLLDHQWKPKIADFGTAKMFLADQTGTQTVVVSPGYASSEYVNGDMTLKCDVFSFGIVLLEVISGRRNSAEPSLLSQAWKLWEEHRVMDLLDPAVRQPRSDPDLLPELRRCIQIGLLCVQQSPGDRPAMSDVLAMLTSKSSHLDQPRTPMLERGTRSPLADDEANGGAMASDPSTVVKLTHAAKPLSPLFKTLVSPRALAADTLGKGTNITEGQALISAGGTFTLGFFSLGTSTKRYYLGIWFTVSREAVCWVANRERPLNNNAGVPVVSDTGSLHLLDGSGQIVWSSNASSTSPAAEAQLLDNGNLVVHDRGSSSILWQSFDHPSNTLLSGMKVGKNLWTGAEWHLTSWRSVDDPSPGAYRRVLDTSGLPDFVTWQGDVKAFRTGPWNGRWFSGVPEASTYTYLVTYQVTTSPGEITYGYTAQAGAPLTRVVVMDTGVVKRLVWDASARAWETFFQGPRDVCDAYGKCGAFGVCDAGAASTSFCSCLEGFSPASPSEWKMKKTSGGCRRNVALDCGAADGLVVVRGVKLPDTHNATVDTSITVEECRARCLANCSCLAYAAADIRGGGEGSGCVIWTDDIIDLRYVDHGQDLFLRLAKSELDNTRSRRISTAVIAAICICSMATVIFLSLAFVFWKNRRCIIWRHAVAVQYGSVAPVEAGKPLNSTTVVSIDLATVQKATRNFSKSNVIGEGAFAVVYEGQLQQDHPLGEGLPWRKIAVKRLKVSSLPNRVLNDFTREVEVLSKLHHDNLVRLLAYCNEGGERILVYEFMQNKSLNLHIFGNPSVRASLNWPKRLEIIQGIARGVCYLHEGSGENVIHRDLKPANVLLDQCWKPKIADFGTAKLGYASPEYANEGDMTLKCDVFSFGVILLEVVSGRRNCAEPSLLSHTWKLWEERRIMDLLDPAVPRPRSDPDILSELRRCIQIGLLCVQQSPGDRPTMTAALAMLTSKSSQLDQPKRPPVDCGTKSPFAGESNGGAMARDLSTVVNLT
ncbi:hypothetical protein EJB05_24074, partial [Eragrostis curvula]